MKYRDMTPIPTQMERADARQVENNAGGFVYQVRDPERLRRFLVLGTEGGTFYASQRDLTKVNVDFLKAYAAKDPVVFYNVLAEANSGNIVPRHSTILLALAILYTHGVERVDDKTERNVAAAAIAPNFDTFVRTGTHLFEFVDYVTQYRGWGRGLRSMIAAWYKNKPAEDLAYQVTKYRQRGGWTHRDLLRKTHPQVEKGSPLANVFDYVTHGRLHFAEGEEATVLDEAVIAEFESVKAKTLEPTQATRLTWEMLPTESLTDPEVWINLMRQNNLPYTALLRNLGRMTSIGVFHGAQATRDAVARLSDKQYVTRARVHPFQVLTALKTYTSGRGFRGSLTWTPKQQIVDALDAAFYASFGNVQATGKRTLIALDVSGSMGSPLMDSNVTAREGSTAMAMATIAADPDTTDTIAFTSGGWTPPGEARGWHRGSIVELGLSPRRRLDDIVRETSRLPFGGTDCALPITWALAHKKVYDTFVVYTDNETWAGGVQPMDALRTYRAQVNRDARLVVVGMTATEFTIADPNDAGALDVVGFDASAPSLISNFSSGKF